MRQVVPVVRAIIVAELRATRCLLKRFIRFSKSKGALKSALHKFPNGKGISQSPNIQ